MEVDNGASNVAVVTRVCLVGSSGNNEELKEQLKNLDIPYLISNDGSDIMDQDDIKFETVFVLENFEGPVFDELKTYGNRILSETIVSQVFRTKQPLPYSNRPLYCTWMVGITICFSNFKSKTVMSKWVDTCHHMGAIVKKDMTAKVDVLVTNIPKGAKFQAAVSLGKLIVKESWIVHCWDQRNEQEAFKATDDKIISQFKFKPFDDCIIFLFGFTDTEKKHMMDIGQRQGAIMLHNIDDNCTHLVVDKDCKEELPKCNNIKMEVVVQDWFWGSIQIEARAVESAYKYKNLEEQKQMLTRSTTNTSLLGTPRLDGSITSNRFSSGKNIRKRLRDEKRSQAGWDSPQNTSTVPSKRPSTDISACLSEAMLDLSNTSNNFLQSPDKKIQKPNRNTARYFVASELLETEKNYLRILNTIITIFQRPLEDPNQARGAILAPEDVKRIFHPLPDIHQSHQSLTEELQQLMDGWDDDTTCIGNVIQKYAEKFQHHYPAFVNFYEDRVNIMETLEKENSRFHAFLKINQAKPECGRQTLAELFICPVQRLPRIILLLQDIKKHTEKENSSHPDISSIEGAIFKFKEVTAHINENKRKTDDQIQLFQKIYEIEACPPTILSSERQYFGKCEGITVDSIPYKKGEHISLYIFSDCIEIAKLNKKKYQTLKSPNIRQINQAKTWKHLKMLSLTHIRHLVNYEETESCRNYVGLYCKAPEDQDYWMLSFRITMFQTNDSAKEVQIGANENKTSFIENLSRHRATCMYIASDDTFVHTSLYRDPEKEATAAVSASSSASKSEKKNTSFRQKIMKSLSFANRNTPKKIEKNSHYATIHPAGFNKTSTLEKTNEYDDASIMLDHTVNSSTLTPSMSVTSLQALPYNKKSSFMTSTTSLMQLDETPEIQKERNQKAGKSYDHFFQSPSKIKRTPGKGKLRPAFSTMNLASEFPAVPTPPGGKSRRKMSTSANKVSSSANKVLRAIKRSSSLRKNKDKKESLV